MLRYCGFGSFSALFYRFVEWCYLPQSGRLCKLLGLFVNRFMQKKKTAIFHFLEKIRLALQKSESRLLETYRETVKPCRTCISYDQGWETLHRLPFVRSRYYAPPPPALSFKFVPQRDPSDIQKKKSDAWKRRSQLMYRWPKDGERHHCPETKTTRNL